MAGAKVRRGWYEVTFVGKAVCLLKVDHCSINSLACRVELDVAAEVEMGVMPPRILDREVVIEVPLPLDVVHEASTGTIYGIGGDGLLDAELYSKPK